MPIILIFFYSSHLLFFPTSASPIPSSIVLPQPSILLFSYLRTFSSSHLLIFSSSAFPGPDRTVQSFWLACRFTVNFDPMGVNHISRARAGQLPNSTPCPHSGSMVYDQRILPSCFDRPVWRHTWRHQPF